MRILTGNVISLVATLFLFLGGIARGRREIYFFQFLECVFLIISQLVFFQIAGAISMCFSALRNHLASKEKFRLPHLVAVFFASAILGLLFNTGGAVGIIPVIASLFLTLAAYFLKSATSVRIAVIINLTAWVVYSIMIRDYVTAVSNLVAIVINIHMLFLVKND